MHRLHPFVAGTVSLGLIAYMAGLVWDASFGTIVMIPPLLGALISCLICRWRPGFDANGWTLLAVAVMANPVVLLALVETSIEWRCMLTPGAAGACTIIGVAYWLIAMGVLLPLGGLAWRWWKRRPAR
jgi:hypothetical protein